MQSSVGTDDAINHEPNDDVDAVIFRRSPRRADWPAMAVQPERGREA
jgi:hypothetical protein